MDDDTARLAASIGKRVRQERKARGWSLDRLADMAGVSRRTLVNVEQGAANPSVGTLLRLGDALGVGVPMLVEPVDDSRLKVTRHGEGAALWAGDGGGRGVLVAGTRAPDVMELWDWTLASGDRHASGAHTPGTRELIQVQQGSLELEVGEERVTLQAGDAVAFTGEQAHAYANPSEEPARFTLAVFEPGVGVRRTQEARHG